MFAMRSVFTTSLMVLHPLEIKPIMLATAIGRTLLKKSTSKAELPKDNKEVTAAPALKRGKKRAAGDPKPKPAKKNKAK